MKLERVAAPCTHVYQGKLIKVGDVIDVDPKKADSYRRLGYEPIEEDERPCDVESYVHPSSLTVTEDEEEI